MVVAVVCGFALAGCARKEKTEDADVPRGMPDVTETTESGGDAKEGEVPAAEVCSPCCKYEESNPWSRECGDDCCGGSCGECPEGFICADAGYGSNVCFSYDECPKICADWGADCGQGIPFWEADESMTSVICECGTCDDGNPCTDGQCLDDFGVEGGACSYTPNDVNTCDDGDPETTEVCKDGQCVYCEPLCDGKTCADGCGGLCVQCDDGLPCTNNDTCVDGVCIGSTDWPPGTGPKPILVLVLDTSETTQWVSGEGWVWPICHDERQTGFDYSKTRWTLLVEALTGTFNDYWCREDDRLGDPEAEDYMSWPPHFAPMGVEIDGEVQQPDGLIDVYGDQVKFVLMAHDPYVHPGLGPLGSYSYGEDKEHQVLGTWNVGIRNKSAPWGALTGPAVDDSPESMTALAHVLQEQILASRPYGETTTPAVLEDAAFFFSHDEAMVFSAEGDRGDVYAGCRSKHVVLITDGTPSLGVGGDGYSTPVAAAALLPGKGAKLHVVGVEIPGTFEPELYDVIAAAGGTETAVVLESAMDLRPALEAVIEEVLTEE